MKMISETISKAFAFCLVIYIASLIIAGDTCTRVHRSSLPIIYSFQAFSFFTKNWTSTETKISILRTEINSAIFFEKFFEKTFGDTREVDSKTVYTCNPN
jgi:hypothetical protein